MKIVALCSCPRLGFMDFMGQSLAAFLQNGVEYRNLYGVFWGQVLSSGIQKAIEDGTDYIITTDYDSLYSSSDVASLIKLIQYNPHADAICSMQMGRFGGLLASNDEGFMTLADLKNNDLIPIATGHFGLTIIRASTLKDLPKPWFISTPDSDGEWKRGSEKVDEDIYFWKNLTAHGKTLFLAPRIVIGHMEVMVKWPDDNLKAIYETTGDYNQYGQPQDTWK